MGEMSSYESSQDFVAAPLLYNEIYHYDYAFLNKTDGGQVPIPVAAKVILGLSYSMAITICGIGNLLLCCSLVRFQRMRTTTNLLIGNIALSDFIVAAVCIPFKFYYYMGILAIWKCYVCYGRLRICDFTHVSVNSLLLIALDRFSCLLLQVFQYNVSIASENESKHPDMLCVLIWVVSLTVAIPTATTTVTTTMYERNDVGEIIVSQKKLWFRNVPGGHMTQQQEMVVEKTKRRTIRMLIIVVTLFAVCWAPFHGYAINRVHYAILSGRANTSFLYNFLLRRSFGYEQQRIQYYHLYRHKR
ncbi:putative prokineticin receptor 2-like [Apostichopus japonicus]|uniref:Putative prokineticin receptor 2-like n=1 Tax=Stichopus japonicus TaxID=307972 RepID=A0A2G8JDX0_STIJA|nr:putative prokineticin receptor 2-like [Apostichopus japonicus]